MYEKMCVRARSEQNTDDEKLNWMKTWVDPVISVLCNSAKMTKTNIIEVIYNIHINILCAWSVICLDFCCYAIID